MGYTDALLRVLGSGSGSGEARSITGLRSQGQRQPLGQLDLQMQQLNVVDDSPPKNYVIEEEDICVHGLCSKPESKEKGSA